MNFVVAILLALAVFNVAFAEHKNELVLLGDENIGEFVKSTRPVFNASALPAEYDLRKLGLLSTDLNQHIPVYCGSCWAHAPLSSLADRIRIKSKGLVRDVIPAVQVMINWATAGTCNGGDSNAANALIYKKGGIPDVTCQQYQAKNMEDTAINTCMNCAPGAGCEAVAEYPKIKVSEYGSVKGDANIMAEIYARGPVSAYINANCLETPEYTGGVIKYDTCITRTTNHAIQINGWGTDENGVDYWICRNSWGSYWGEHGFFRIVRGGNWNVGTAYWAEPAIEEFL